jgi:hypothetical protein
MVSTRFFGSLQPGVALWILLFFTSVLTVNCDKSKKTESATDTPESTTVVQIVFGPMVPSQDDTIG